jgi:hypothetical protein
MRENKSIIIGMTAVYFTYIGPSVFDQTHAAVFCPEAMCDPHCIDPIILHVGEKRQDIGQEPEIKAHCLAVSYVMVRHQFGFVF